MPIERRFMIDHFSTPPIDSFYEQVPLPYSWILAHERLRGKLVLDIGAASGWIAYKARYEGATVIASDIFTTHMNKTLERVQCDNKHLPFQDNTFDFVLTANVLHHDELFEVVKEVHRVLKDDGELISFQEPCIPNDYDEIGYLNEYCLKEIESGIKEHRPSLEKYKHAMSCFSRVNYYYMEDIIFNNPIQIELKEIVEESHHGGITIKAVK